MHVQRLRRGVQLLVLLCGCAFLPAVRPALAQPVFGDARDWLSATNENSYRTWTVEVEGEGSYEARQVSSRLFSTLSLAQNFDLVIGTAAGWSQDRRVENSALDSIGDVKAKGFLYALERRLLLSAGINLPTGSTSLNEEEVRALQAIQPTVLGFRMREYGRGFGLDLGAALGHDVTPRMTVGGGIGYLYAGEYDLDQTAAFQPGGEFTFTLGTTYNGVNARGGADVVYRIFGTDQTNGADSFEEGAQLELTARGSVRNGRAGLDLLVRNVIKDDNTVIVEGATSGAGENVVENGNTLWLYAVPRFDVRPWLSFKGLFDLVNASQSQQQSTSAWAAGFGLGLEVRMSPVAILDVRAQKLTGKSEDDRVDLSGWDAVLAIRWQK